MSTSFTLSETQTFTITHARYLASKVATDLKRMQRFYGFPSDSRIVQFEEELALYLKNGYLLEVKYGFQRGNDFIEPTLIYTARQLNGGGIDDDPGRISPGANVSGAVFKSYLVTNSAFNNLTTAQQEAFENTLPVNRTGAPAPGISGIVVSDKSYSSGGRSLDRSSIKSY